MDGNSFFLLHILSLPQLFKYYSVLFYYFSFQVAEETTWFCSPNCKQHFMFAHNAFFNDFVLKNIPISKVFGSFFIQNLEKAGVHIKITDLVLRIVSCETTFLGEQILINGARSLF